MKHAAEPIVGVNRRQHPDVMASLQKLLRQGFYVGENPSRVRVGIRGNQSYAHLGMVSHTRGRTGSAGRVGGETA
jgi:hypothetical protein